MHAAKLIHRLFVIATALMIKNITTAAGAKFVYITWSEPEFRPASYQVKITCRRMDTETEYVCMKLEVSPLDTMLTVDKLLPGSRCVFTLHATYNPASIDDGITFGISTLSSCVYI